MASLLRSPMRWLIGRAFGRYTFIRQQSQIQPATISAYLSALRSVHVDLKLPTTDFDDDNMKRFMAGIHNLFPPAPRTTPRTAIGDEPFSTSWAAKL
ncbi:hypothetical protein E4U31_007867 [Claviceps sp. LM219 group G6]|nr:hypothetical protein E4U31_007867 [Claviceps sp. LM219 group G6]